MIKTFHFVPVTPSLLAAKRSKFSQRSGLGFFASRSAAVWLLHSRLFILASRSAAVWLLATLCMSSVTAQVPSYVPTNGLVGWWPFNGNANDESGNGNNGTVNGATLTTDRFGVANKAYSFDGTSNSISVANSSTLNLSVPCSFRMWIKIPSYPTNGKELYFMSKFSQGGVAMKGFHMAVSDYNNSDALFYRYRDDVSSNWGQISFSNSILPSTGTWFQLVIVSDATSDRAYINGTLVITAIPSAIMGSNSENLLFGNGQIWDPSTTLPFQGMMDDIAIYNRALSQQEINNLYVTSSPPNITTSASPSLINCGESATLAASSTSAVQPCIKADLPTTLQNGLVGYWPFCGNANDASGNNNNGTVNGATLTTDRFGNANSAFNFNGGQNRIVVNNAILPNTPSSYTISMWVLSNTAGMSTGELICDRSQSNYDYKYRLHFRDDLPGSPLSFASVSNQNVSGTLVGSFITSVWRQIVAVGNSSNNTTAIYIDGQLVGNCGFYYPLHLNSTTFGANFAPGLPGYDSSFNGKIDDIAIYNRALTATEIQQLYNLGNVSYSWSTGATTPSISVSPAQTTSYTCTATNSAGATTSSVTVTVADTLTWTGAVDTDWHKACNWSPEFVPRCCNPVKIPLTTNQPIISGVAAAKELQIFTTDGAQVKVNNGANLQIETCPTPTTNISCP